MKIIKSDTAGEQNLGSASLPGLSLRLLDEPAQKTGLLLSFLWRLILYPCNFSVRCFRVIFFLFFLVFDNPREMTFLSSPSGAEFDCSSSPVPD